MPAIATWLGRELNVLQKQLGQILAEVPGVLRRCPLAERYRWQLEELRVSLFAQTLGNAWTEVSSKRLRELWPQVVAQVQALG